MCWKIHNKYVFRVNIHIFVLKYLVQIQIIQNQFKISEGGKWNSHQMSCVYSSRMVKNYRICPIRIKIIRNQDFATTIRQFTCYSVIFPHCARGIICLRPSYSRISKHCMSFFNLISSCIIFVSHFINCFNCCIYE